jgi:hypothetical protein
MLRITCLFFKLSYESLFHLQSGILVKGIAAPDFLLVRQLAFTPFLKKNPSDKLIPHAVLRGVFASGT